MGRVGEATACASALGREALQQSQNSMAVLASGAVVTGYHEFGGLKKFISRD